MTCEKSRIAPLAQLDRASASGAEGQRFESSVARCWSPVDENHNHTVSLTQAQLQMINTGGSVMVTSTGVDPIINSRFRRRELSLASQRVISW